jgi:nucleoside-diphosphate-sugar epimerase
MRVLITGSTGVIGRLAVPLLLRNGHRVTAVGRSTKRLESLGRLGASTVALDLFDRDAVGRAIASHDAVINLATHIPPPGLGTFLRSAWRENDRIRTQASALLAEAARAAGVSIFIQESFAPIYPDSWDRWITEATPLNPVRYNRSVLDAERSAERFAGEGGRGIALRFAFFYGAGDPFTQTVLSSVRRGWLPVFGDADGYFSTVSHENAASAVVAALHAPSGVYNVVDSDPLTRRQLGDMVAGLIGVAAPKVPPRWVAKLFGGVGEMLARSLRISNRKLMKAGWTPRYASARESWLAALRNR